jgi:hypothetical protein
MKRSRAGRTARALTLLGIGAAGTVVLALSAGAAGPARRQPCVVGLEVSTVLSLPEDLRLRAPESIAVDHRGHILIADSGNHRVVVLTRDGEQITEFGGYGWDDGQFDTPSDLSVYKGFFTYVLDRGNRRVERFDVDGDYVDRLVDEDEAGSPVALAVGREGGLLILDADSQTVLSRSQFNEELASVGQFGTGDGGLVRPTAVAVGPAGEIGVADPGRSAVLVFDEFGSSLYELSMPDTLAAVDLVFCPSGAALAVDESRGRVVAFPPGGGSATASLEVGESFRPVALTLDGEDELLVLDSERGDILFIEITYAECGVRR